MRLWGALLLILLARMSVAQGAESPITLKSFSSSVLGVPAFSYGENAQCDEHGNLFFHATKAFNDVAILKLAPDQSTTFYTLPMDEAQKVYFLAFRVTRKGKLWVLTHVSHAKDLYLYQFGGNSEEPDKIELRAPDGLKASNFVMLADDRVALYGYFDEDAPASQRSKSYFGLFDQSGRLVRDSLRPANQEVLERAKTRVPDAGAAQASDGQTYILQGNSIIVLSPDGERVKELSVPSPGEGYVAGDVFAEGAFLCIKYRKQVKNQPLVAEYALLDRNSGELIRYYVPSSELGNNLVCFSDEGFTFLRYENHRVKLLSAKP